MKEEEIRPCSIFDEYLHLAAQDANTYFSDVKRVACNCPACGAQGEKAIIKHGFTYELCPNCETLYVSPRPVMTAFKKYYTDSPSSKYWASTFYRATESSRREKQWRPKAKIVAGVLRKSSTCEGWSIVDIGGGYGLFSEEIRTLLVGVGPVVIEPAPHLAEVCRSKNLLVIEKFLEDVTPSDLPAGPRAFVSFELFEHLHDPENFLICLNKLMASGDMFIFSTLSGVGVDIQVLWENSKSVMPPHHLNFFNPHSIAILLERCGFDSVEISTPGALDIDILMNNRHLIKDRFWRSLVNNSTDAERQHWQDFISYSGKSSHMMVVARKS